LEEQVAALRKELKERGPLSQEQEKTLDAFLRQWMERNINQSASPLVDMSFLQLKVNFVPLSMVKELNESDLEAGVTFGMFTLFLGLAVQELLSKAAITSTVLVLFLATGILFGFTVYTLYKARVRKAEVEKNARDKSVPVKVIWGGKSTPEHER
jgi:L-cystine uptake protein TcyP (sodium:dicarboxylate symporter family)